MAGRIVDLTLTVQEGMQTFPTHWHPMVEISQLGRHGIEDRETRKLVLGTHTGTHVDAPAHFIPGGLTIDKVPLKQLVGPARVLDFSAAEPGQELGVTDLTGRLGDTPPAKLVLRFDWSDQLGTMAYYSDHPYLSQEAARWLVEGGCHLLAMDTPMPDDPRNGRGTTLDSPNHKIVLGAGALLVEYLTNLRELRTEEVELIVAPLKIRDGDGAPARCLAIEPAEGAS